MKTKIVRFCARDCWYRLPLLAAILGLLTLLPFQRTAAQGQALRNGNGDLLPASEDAAPTPVVSLSTTLRGWLPSDFRHRGGVFPDGTTGVSTWTGGTGNWSNSAMWNPVNPPNDGSADVFVDGGNVTASVVTVDGTFTVGRLTIDAGDSVIVANNNDLRMATGAFVGSGSIVNNGSFSLNSTGNTTRLLLTGNGGVTLSGSGTMTMGVGTQVTGDSFNALFTNQSTIQGAGNIGANIIDVNNQGLIDANLAFTGINSLYLDASGTFTNSGTLRASNGGLLQLGASAYANTGGTILATGAGSVVQIETNAAISGGTLSTASGGLIQSAAGATVSLTNLSNTGNYQVTNNSDTYIVGTIANSGTITLNSGGNNTRLMLTTGGATLSGGGSVILAGSTSSINGNVFNAVLTNQNNTISGVGNIGVNTIDVNNQSLIDANVPFTGGNLLVIDPNVSVTNTGTLRASNGGLLDLGGGSYLNAGGTILATGTGSVVQLDNNSAVSGGTLATSGGGIIQTAPGISAALASVSNTGRYLLTNNSDTRFSGTINNSGTITLRAAGNQTRFVVPGATGSNTILSGGGSVILDDSLGTANQITGDNFSSILTNQNNTISGVGNIGVNIIDINNQSLIDANVPFATASHTLVLDPTSTLTNTGTLRASNGGFLDLGGGTYANAGGTILATGTNSIVQLDNGATVSGGTISTSGGGLVQTAANISVSLDSVTNTGAYQALNNSDTRLSGTITNSGTITLKPSGNAVRLLVIGPAGTNVTFSGGGNIVMDDSLGTNSQITGDNFGNIFTNQNNTISGAGNIGVNIIDIVNGGVINADRANGLTIDPNSTFLNNAGGILRGSGSVGLFLAGGTYTNNGTFEALNGSSVFMDTSTVLTNNNSGVLTGGTYRAIASGGGATLTIRGANITQIASGTEVDLSGAGSVFQVGSTALETTLTQNSGTLRVLGNRNYSNANNLSNDGTIELGGGTFAAPTFTISSSGELFGFGTVTVRPGNSGLVRAVGGTLSLTNGVGASGTVRVDPTGLLDLSSSGAASSADFLTQNGIAAGSLALGSQNFVVGLDYTNASFGVGNTFDPRANVTGSGLITAAGNVGQTLTGNITSGTSTAPTMAFGNVHVGDTNTKNFQINNTGTSGPVLRGALQTGVNGGNITDARLGGSGVTASNFGPIALNSATGNLGVTFNATSAGALTSQVVHIINNFDNVQEQNLSITGAAYRYALPTAHSPEPVNFGNFHVGATAPSQVLSITNNVPNDGFSEALNASIGSPTGGVTTNGGSFSLLGPTATDNTSLSVGIDITSAGNKNGTATITLQSDGTGSSGLGTTNLTSQTVNVTGSVFRLAAASTHSPEPVVLANQHVGGSVTQAISLTNSAANDSFSEKLDASFTSTTGNATASGSFNLLGPGATNSTALLVGVDTSTGGARSGTAIIGLVSDGTGTSGLANTTLTSQTVNVSGNVYRYADPTAHSPEPVQFGVRHIGDSVSDVALSLKNNAANDNFSESLNASISTSSSGLSATGSFTGLAPGSTDSTSLSVGINTTTAGSRNGTATVALQSNGAGSSGLGLTNLTSQTVNVTGQVNFFADPVLVFKMGSATLTMNSATSFTLSFGQVAQNSGSYMASFGVQNSLHDLTYQDSLGGTFNTTNATNFGVSGFGPFSGIIPGGALDPNVSFDSSQNAGNYSNTVTLSPTSTNASGTSNLNDITLTLQGQIIVVPEPNTWAMIFAGGGMLVLARRFVRRRD